MPRNASPANTVTPNNIELDAEAEWLWKVYQQRLAAALPAQNDERAPPAPTAAHKPRSRKPKASA